MVQKFFQLVIGENAVSREEFIEVFDVLAEEGAIVEDGTWTERYIDRILNTEKAAVAAVEAIDDDEAMAPHLDPLTGIQVRSRVGRSDKFPPHLHATKSCFFEQHPGFLPCQSLETEAPSRLKEDLLSVQM